LGDVFKALAERSPGELKMKRIEKACDLYQKVVKKVPNHEQGLIG
jgi:hypothetical protein